MMRGFQAKFVLAVVAVYVLVGVISATSTLLPHGSERSSWHIDCRHGLTKILGRKEGSFGCQKIVPSRSLRASSSRSPPAPVKNIPNGFSGPPPPDA